MNGKGDEAWNVRTNGKTGSHQPDGLVKGDSLLNAGKQDIYIEPFAISSSRDIFTPPEALSRAR